MSTWFCRFVYGFIFSLYFGLFFGFGEFIVFVVVGWGEFWWMWWRLVIFCDASILVLGIYVL